MAIALVQQKSNQGSAVSTIDVTLPAAPTNGNFVAFVVGVGSTRTATVTDLNGKAYTATPNGPSSNTNRGVRTYIFYLANASGAHQTLRITASGSGAMSGFAAEFSGIATTSPYENDVARSSSLTNTATNLNDPGMTTVNNGDLIIGGVGATNPNAAGGIFSLIDLVQAGYAGEWGVQTTAGAITVQFTQGSNTQWCGSIAAFKAATGGGAVQVPAALLLESGRHT